MLSYCEENISEHHAIYWKSTVNSLMSEIFYTIDGYTIFGLSTDEDTKCNFLFNEMSEFLDSDFSYVTVENPAPKNLLRFVMLVSRYKLVSCQKNSRVNEQSGFFNSSVCKYNFEI